jgi:hypothetical protein
VTSTGQATPHGEATDLSLAPRTPEREVGARLARGGRGLALLILVAGALAPIGLPVATVARAAGEDARYRELHRVIDRNTGFAHMTRGVNMYTLIALRSCVTEADVPVLTAMLADRDYVTQLAAAGILVDLGEAGQRGLTDGLQRAADFRARQVLQEALHQADDPNRRPLAEYPLTDRERKGIRGCAPRRRPRPVRRGSARRPVGAGRRHSR